jgi:hypothetical protein
LSSTHLTKASSSTECLQSLWGTTPAQIVGHPLRERIASMNIGNYQEMPTVKRDFNSWKDGASIDALISANCAWSNVL